MARVVSAFVVFVTRPVKLIGLCKAAPRLFRNGLGNLAERTALSALLQEEISHNLIDGPISDAYPSLMNSKAKNGLEFIQIKVVALAVSDAERANHFYRETLGLAPDNIRHMKMAFMIGNVTLLLKPQADWYGKPTAELNARITLEVKDAYATEKALLERGVKISDPVTLYGDYPIGAFFDSEGNKLWFCSDSGKS
jgi:catechol 2,3-dioxygenase-like lactoylglutathione lyase family enzyme